MKFTVEVNPGGVLVLAVDLSKSGLDLLLIRKLIRAIDDIIGLAYPVPVWTDEAAVAKYITAMTPAASTAISIASQLMKKNPAPAPPGPPTPGV